jgi:hypothetical protein
MVGRKQRDPCDQGLHDASASVERERWPLLFEVSVGEGIEQVGGAEGAELPVEQLELAAEATTRKLIFGLDAPPGTGLQGGLDGLALAPCAIGRSPPPGSHAFIGSRLESDRAIVVVQALAQYARV